MAFKLAAPAAQAGYRLVSYDTIGSTSAEARRRVGAGERGPLWIVAARQTEGYGRRGRPWATPEGNLAASLFLSVDAAPALAATLGFAAALAVEAAVRDLTPTASVRGGLDAAGSAHDRLRLKWPNDLLVDGRKLAGIMLESVETGRGLALVVGIGVNVACSPKDLPYPATSLAELGSESTPEALFTALSARWVDAEQRWDSGRGLPVIREEWLARAAGIGSPVAVTMGGRMLRGMFETIDETGRLVVRQADGQAARIAAGEVHFGAAATAAAG